MYLGNVMSWPDPPSTASAVLCSGGLDSVVLLAWAAQRAPAQPIYVRAGLAWEIQEIQALERLVPQLGARGGAQGTRGAISSLAVLDFDVRDLYAPSHWALVGKPPAYDTPDEDVYLPGRNILLLSKAAVFASSRGIGRILLGPLSGNPFPDATANFFRAMSEALALGLARPMSVEAPFATLHKADVIRLGASLGVPLSNALSRAAAADQRTLGRADRGGDVASIGIGEAPDEVGGIRRVAIVEIGAVCGRHPLATDEVAESLGHDVPEEK